MKKIIPIFALLAAFGISHVYAPNAFAHEDDEIHTHADENEDFDSNEDVLDDERDEFDREDRADESARDRRKRQTEEARRMRDSARERRRAQKEEIRELRKNRGPFERSNNDDE